MTSLAKDLTIRKRNHARWVLPLGIAAALGLGCKPATNPDDPWEGFNRASYNFNDGLDRHVLKPAADGYVKIIPKPVRTSVGHAFDNLVYLDVVVNDYLQKKPDQGWSDLRRFATNSTVGILGLFDPATNWGLPVHENDLGITLRKWGVKPGPYIVIPVLGPSTAVDVADYPMTYVLTPTNWFNLSWKITVPLYVVDTVDLRSRYDRVMRFRNETAIDPYVFTREAFLAYRLRKANDGKATSQPSMYDEDLDTPAAATHASEAPSNAATAPINYLAK